MRSIGTITFVAMHIETAHTLLMHLQEAGHPAKSEGMMRYMKNQFEYFGVTAPIRKEIAAPFIKNNWKEPKAIQWDLVEFLWDATQREAQYVALDYLEKHWKYIEAKDIKHVEYLITTKSWWDTVDFLAAKGAGTLLLKFPALREIYLPKWEQSGNMWLLRTAIIFQLFYKDQTDLTILEGLVERNKSNREFFIRKALGWALRQYSKTNPERVEEICYEQQLTGLTLREALKDIERKKLK
jgi:3-methyladenine DNA glycosylase AlkD